MKAVQGTLFSGSHGQEAHSQYAYRGTVASRVAGITYRQLDYWDRKHIVCPSLHESHGSGTRRLYSFRDIVLLSVMKRLLDAGVVLQNASLAIAQLSHEPVSQMRSLTIMSDGKSVRQCTDDRSILALLKGGNAVFGLSVSMIYSDVSARLEKENFIDLSEQTVSDRTGRLTQNISATAAAHISENNSVQSDDASVSMPLNSSVLM